MRIMDAENAVQMIHDHNCVWVVCSGGGVNEPYKILEALENRYLKTQNPKALKLCHSAGIGDKCGGGADRFAHKGMVRSVLGSHWTWSPGMQKLALQNEVEAYILPQGIMVQLARAIAGGRPGIISHVGLHTFIDPRIEGGAVNSISQKPPSEIISVDGKEYIFYKSFLVDVAIIRATTADEDGNLSFEEEGVYLEAISAAQAAKNSGGIVLAQVKRIVERKAIKAIDVKVPGIFVDGIVVEKDQRQTYRTHYNPAYSGQYRVALQHEATKFPLTERKVIVKRAALELAKHMTVNLGFGVAAGIAEIMKQERCQEDVYLTLEQGLFGGVPAEGSDFGMSENPMAIIDEAYQFDWYDGGGLDIAFLSFAEIDREGNVNVSRFGDKLIGVGGFINISQNAKTVVFLGTFTAVGLKELICNGIEIQQEGSVKKFVDSVQQISFSSKYAKESGQRVLYITERAVFQLKEEGLELIEKAPGIDLEKDILNQMEFRPVISEKLKDMDSKLFQDGKIFIREVWGKQQEV